MTKSYRQQWLHHGAIIRQPGKSFQVEIAYDGQRQRVTKESLADAKTYAEQQAVTRKHKGVKFMALTEGQRQVAVKAVELLGIAPQLLPYLTIGLFAGIRKPALNREQFGWLPVELLSIG